jgi:putative spermidine/putrescine transport system permease protein
MSAAIIRERPAGLMGKVSDYLWRHPKAFLLILLTPPLLWLGIIYVGSLFALLLQISTSSCARFPCRLP